MTPQDHRTVTAYINGYILSLGSCAEVLEPEHIREIIKTRAKEIMQKLCLYPLSS
jgi:predicted DNA-binding transcriptional regulator YafY